METRPLLLRAGLEGNAPPEGVAPLMASIRSSAHGSKCAAPAEVLSDGTAEAKTVFFAVLFCITVP